MLRGEKQARVEEGGKGEMLQLLAEIAFRRVGVWLSFHIQEVGEGMTRRRG